MYEVIHEFADLLDDNHVYRVGDVYPRSGGKTTLDRATELMGKNNKIGQPLIKDIDESVSKAKEVEEAEAKKTASKGRK